MEKLIDIVGDPKARAICTVLSGSWQGKAAFPPKLLLKELWATVALLGQLTTDEIVELRSAPVTSGVSQAASNSTAHVADDVEDLDMDGDANDDAFVDAKSHTPLVTSTEAANLAVKNNSAAPIRKSFCKSLWLNRVCNDLANCDRLHVRCTRAACQDLRDPRCPDFHGRIGRLATKHRRNNNNNRTSGNAPGMRFHPGKKVVRHNNNSNYPDPRTLNKERQHIRTVEKLRADLSAANFKVDLQTQMQTQMWSQAWPALPVASQPRPPQLQAPQPQHPPKPPPEESPALLALFRKLLDEALEARGLR
jgi:hypothetical protein